MTDNYTKIQTVDLIAPADMPGGYQFSADVNGSHVLVQVVSEITRITLLC